MTGADISGDLTTHCTSCADGLSEREREVLTLITNGLSNGEIAAELYLSINSIKTHVRSIYRKIGATSRTKAVIWGVRHGLLEDGDHAWRPIPARENGHRAS